MTKNLTFFVLVAVLAILFIFNIYMNRVEAELQYNEVTQAYLRGVCGGTLSDCDGILFVFPNNGRQPSSTRSVYVVDGDPRELASKGRTTRVPFPDECLSTRCVFQPFVTSVSPVTVIGPPAKK
jgi:hypothetical protein